MAHSFPVATGIDEKGRQIEMSDAARYHMTGNGVVAPIAEHIALNILEAVAGENPGSEILRSANEYE